MGGMDEWHLHPAHPKHKKKGTGPLDGWMGGWMGLVPFRSPPTYPTHPSKRQPTQVYLPSCTVDVDVLLKWSLRKTLAWAGVLLFLSTMAGGRPFRGRS